MKKTLCFVIAMLLLFVVAGCGAAPSSAPSLSGLSSSYTVLPAPSQPAAGRASVLTGLQVAEDYAGGRRLAAVVVGNHSSQRPQRGLSQAQILIEMPVEMGISRFVALYEDYANMPEVGPVRSSRDAFLQMVMPFQPLFVCEGSSQPHQYMLTDYDWHHLMLDSRLETGAVWQDPSKISNDISNSFYTSGQLITEAVQAAGIDDKREYRSTYFNFGAYDAAPRRLEGEAAGQVHIPFSSDDAGHFFFTEFSYDAAAGKYAMQQSLPADGTLSPVVDETNGEALSFDNLIILFAPMPVHEGLDIVLDIQLLHGGVGYYINGGVAAPIFWGKDSPMHALQLYPAQGGDALVVNPGTSYVAVVDCEKEPMFTLTA